MASAYPEALVPQVVSKSVGTSAAAIFSTTQLVMEFSVSANKANTGTIYLGSSSVSASASIHLNAGDVYTFDTIYSGGSNPKMTDMSQWYLRASVASQKCSVLKIRKEKELS